MGWRYLLAFIFILGRKVSAETPNIVSLIAATIEEEVPVGTPVVVLRATVSSGSVTYAISGVDAPLFKIDSQTGNLTTNGRLDRESKNEYSIAATITHVQSQDKATTTIKVFLTDINDNDPVFHNLPRTIPLLENFQLSTTFFQISCTDSDLRKNAELDYLIQSGNTGNKFEVDSNGNLKLKASLDYETVKSYNLSIMAKDNGLSNQRSSSSYLVINVLDYDDLPAKFEKSNYDASVAENSPKGTSVTTVKAVDQDLSLNAPVSYRIDEVTNPGTAFAINANNGTILVNGNLDRENISSYKIRVLAKSTIFDGEYAYVTITITDVNDNPPRFLQTSYSASIPENTPVLKTFLTVSAVDPDLGTEPKVGYDPVGGDGVFGVNNQGEIFLKKSVDREAQSVHDFVVVAVETGTNRRDSSVKVRVTVTDINDNSPVFNETSYNVTTTENMKTGTVIGKVEATDKDSGANGLITYSIFSDAKGHHFAFKINSESGEVATTKSLDREETSVYTIIIIASDRAIGETRLSSNVTMTIHVADENDNTPKFAKSLYETSIEENTDLNTMFATLTATDPDAGSNGMIRYRISSGDTTAFAIGASSGKLENIKVLDRETTDSFKLTVQATDGGGKVGSTEVNVVVKDVNDHKPNFTQSVYRFSVNEETSNAIIGDLKVNDKDIGQNAKIEFRLVTPFTNITINKDTGRLSTTGRLNRESKSSYTLMVVALDSGTPTPKASEAIVEVTVLDTNDHKPKFDPKLYAFHVTENVAAGQFGTLRATDGDIGINAKLRFVIAEGNAANVFSISPSTGVISTTTPLNREQEDFYVLSVKVMDKDGGSGSLEDFAVVRVTVRDANDHDPMFTKTSYSTTLYENMTLGKPIIQFHAKDNDTGVHGMIVYAITSGDPNRKFSIDSVSGTVILQAALDRDAPSNDKVFTMTVSAKDGATPARSSTVQWHVTVNDVNDNSPKCNPASYTARVPENTPKDTTIVRPACVDVDEGNNGKISYSLSKGANEGFSVDPSNGHIKITRVFNYDGETKSFTLMLDVKDAGTPSQTTKTEIKVEILNVNDNSPVFTESLYKFQVQEGDYSQNAQRVGKVTAVDADADGSSSTFGTVKYKLLDLSSFKSSYYWPFKKMEQNGALLDRKRNASAFLNGATFVTDPTYGAVVLVGGNPQWVNMGTYSKHCISNPSYCSKGLTVSIFLKFEAGGYVMSSGAQATRSTGFSFNLESGRYRVRVATNTTVYELVRTSIPLTWFMMTFTWSKTNGLQYYENGKLISKDYTMKAEERIDDSHTLLTLGRPNDADQYPELYGRFSVGEFVIWELELDAREVEHFNKNSERRTGKILPNETLYLDKFVINSATGEISTNKVIDREMYPMFDISVAAMDGDVISPKMNYSEVMVSVLDVNDNSPVFSKISSMISVTENVKAGTFVTRIMATDPDEGSNGQIKFSLNGGNTGDAFYIDPSTGEIKTAQPIDREKIASYSLQVIATDSGSPPRSSALTVTIEVKDENDEAPRFTPSVFVGSIKENLPAEQSILQVVSTDKDLGMNGKVTYALQSTKFRINNVTGSIYSVVSLDREMQASYKLTVTATDSGKPAKSSSTEITIHVVDENDNKPKFEKPKYLAAVSESRKFGAVVTTITATDPDQNDNGKLKYTLTGGDGNFVVNSTLGTILLAKEVDREKTPNGFVLSLTASDSGTPPLSSSVQVVVNISDENDNAPVFNKFSYSGSVPENAVGRIAGNVSATDKDNGLSGEIFYTITGGNIGNVFEIDKNGFIKTIKPLDRESKASYELTIRATDRGGDPKSTEVEMDVKVIDVNDERPVIGPLPKEIKISESTLIGTRVASVVATDADEGKNAELIFFGLAVDSKFEIDKNTGVITTKGQLDFEGSAKSHIFYVYAQDHGDPILRSVSVPVTFVIIDANDNNPEFKPSSYFVSIKENAAVGKSVITVSATEKDSPENSKITYSITAGDMKKRFKINETSGLLSVNGTLDRETEASYAILITASDNGKPPRLGQALVTVSIDDVNDIPPKFEFKDYRAEVTENAPIGRTVSSLTAKDGDSSSSFKLSYQIVAGNIDNVFSVETIFTQENYNAVIKVNGNIDRERVPMYTLTIQVSDGIFSDRVNLQVKVTDVNDNTPTFNLTTFKATINEHSAPGVSIIRVIARDRDLDKNAVITYSLTGDEGRFMIDKETGEIRTTNFALDRELKPWYALTAYATDTGGLKGSTIVNVSIADINDNSPVFNPDSYTFVIQEGAGSEDRVVARVKATDVDAGQNGKVQYQLYSGNLGDTFIINRDTGVVSTKRVVDREVLGLQTDNTGRGVFTLLIQAFDRGLTPKYGRRTAAVNVYVTDINDNPPVFPSSGYKIDISEGADANQNVFVATATDRDAGNNSRITYEIIKGNTGGDFKINANTGLIQTNNKLGRNRLFSYNITVQATDNGYPSFRTSTIVRIKVGDLNDNDPVFTSSNYSVSITENKPVDTLVVRVTATDADTGQNAKITYSIVGGNEGDSLKIITKDNHGEVLIAKPIDREKISIFNLVVLGKDGGVPFSRSALTRVHVTVGDENDNVPKFSHVSYSGTVAENAPAGTTINLQTPVYATDADVGLNSDILYRISGDARANFSIDGKTGVIRTSATVKIDYETQKFFNLTVTATDQKGFGKQATTKLDITVLDQNDNTPKFTQNYYLKSISEDIRSDSSVITVKANDPDSGIFGKVSYTIIGGSEGKFKINRDTGLISTVGTLNRETRAAYLLQVSGVDGSFYPKEGFCSVSITLTDVNDNKPVFSESVYNAEISEAADIGTTLVTVTATDADFGIGGIVSYYLESNVFLINNATGMIKTRQRLDRERVGSYTLPVMAVDGGKKRTNVSVNVIVKDENDQTPYFPGGNRIKTDVTEKSSVGTILIMLAAQDKDIGDNSKLKYNISKNATEYIKVDENTGVISVAKIMERDALFQLGIVNAAGTYSFEVTATDGGKPPLMATATVEINILPFNNKNPVFNSSSYIVKVFENVSVGHEVIKLQATKNSLLSVLTYSFLSAEEYFSINKLTGSIKVKKGLDREKSASHTFSIQVSDSGDPPRSGFTTVSVEVLDVNDNVPTFQFSPPYNMAVSEDASIGKSIGHLRATDGDTGMNKVFTYKFTRADIGTHNAFVQLDNRCIKALGMEDQSILAAQITGSSTRIEPNKDFSTTQGRLNNRPYQIAAIQYQGAWCAGNSRRGEYLQVDFVTKKVITRMATQGRPHGTEYAKLYTLRYSDDNTNWIRYGKDFSGNTDTDTVVTNDIIPEIRARYIRIFPSTWNAGICLRVEFYGCNYVPGEIVRVPVMINANSGEVVVSGPMDREHKSKYTIIVEAVDKGNPPLPSMSAIVLNVLDANDNKPNFTSSVYRATIPENALGGHQVTTLHATDSDNGSNSRLKYSLQNGQGKFIVEESSGIVRVASSLDYEKVKSYTITAVVTDGGTPALSSTAYLLVTVSDFNDNAPVFEKQSYEIAISEATLPNTTFLTMRASDADQGSNAKVSYELKDNSKYFKIGSESGEIQSKMKLDREDFGSITLTVVAKDSGMPPLSMSTKVAITIDDVNDNTPRFLVRSFNQKISEGTPVGSIVLKVSAVDKDSGKNGEILYFIPDAFYREIFFINNKTGEIMLRKPLDRETRPLLSFLIIASDGGTPRRNDNALVDFQVTDENDNAPVLTPNVMHVSLMENSPVGTFVVDLNATDKDLGKNSKLIYSISHGDDNKYSINSTNGYVRVSAPLDREMKNSYSVVVMVRDSGQVPYLAFGTIYINILDINDNVPEFMKVQGPFRIFENEKNGTVVGTVSATDKDIGDNAVITYSVAAGNSSALFSIDATSGVLRTKVPLDREKARYHDVIIIATNSKSMTPLESNTTITVEVIDKNDSPPQFTKKRFMGTVSEAAKVGTEFMEIKAVDPDVGANSKVVYRMVHNMSDKESEYFTVNSQSGVISLQASILDKELRNVTIIVEAEDLGVTGSLKSKAEVLVMVEDVNDNKPTFVQKVFKATPAESLAIGAKVGQVTAMDSDGGANADMLYEIIQGNEKGHFRINNSTGAVYLKSKIDREKQSKFVLTIKVTNRGSVHTTNNRKRREANDFSLATLEISVMDVNDNRPYFIRRTFTGGVLEGAGIGSKIMNIKGVDPDTGNSSILEYRIIGGNDNGFFVIERNTGDLKTAKLFLGKKGIRYDITLSLRDNNGKVPYNQAFNASTARVFVLLDNQRNLLVAGVDMSVIQNNRDEFNSMLNNITESSTRIERVFKVFTSSGTPRTEIYFHAVDENRAAILTTEQVKSIMQRHSNELATKYSKWKIEGISSSTAKSVGKESLKDYIIALIVLGIIGGVLIIFGLVLLAFSKHKSKRKRMDTARVVIPIPNDGHRKPSKKNEIMNNSKLGQKGGEGTPGWVNLYDDWWNRNDGADSKEGKSSDSMRYAKINPSDTYLYQSKMKILRQGILTSQARQLVSEDETTRDGYERRGRIAENPLAEEESNTQESSNEEALHTNDSDNDGHYNNQFSGSGNEYHAEMDDSSLGEQEFTFGPGTTNEGFDSEPDHLLSEEEVQITAL